MPIDSMYEENIYVLDNENLTETARLSFQDRLLARDMGGALPEYSDLSHVRSILDLACGTGGWVLDVAWAYPKIDVVGIDVSQRTVAYALAQARGQGLDNARFQTMNILRPLNFPDNTFDLINARLLFAVVPPLYWPQLLEECHRILRPGGVLRLTEWEFSFLSSTAYERLVTLFVQALDFMGKSFSPDGRHLGITPLLEPFLTKGGYQNIKTMPHIIDWSVGTNAHEGWRQNSVVLLQNVRSFMLETGVVAAEEYEALYQQTLIDMLADDFCGILFLLTAWGEKDERR